LASSKSPNEIPDNAKEWFFLKSKFREMKQSKIVIENNKIEKKKSKTLQDKELWVFFFFFFNKRDWTVGEKKWPEMLEMKNIASQ
jgi:hypothetical protein